MPSIHLRGLSYAHDTATPVLTDVDLDLAAEPNGSWVGVVGVNGAGKTTLLELVAGLLAPTAGRVDVHAEVPPMLVRQPVDEPDPGVMDLASRWDGPAMQLRGRLDLDETPLLTDPDGGWRRLSPGQRKRWQVAAALSVGPDVLLLDEPTNHLDGDARRVLVDALRRHRGLGLVVSHDRALLDELTDRTLRVHTGSAELHTGPYSEAAERWRAEDAATRDRHARARREARRERRILADVRRDRHSAEAYTRRSRREAGASQPDAREAGRKAAQRKAEAELGARVAQMRRRVADADAALDTIDVERDHRGAVALAHEATGRRVLAEVRGDVAHAGGAVWLRDVDVVLHRGDRVHVRGANGAGKSTLLRAVLDRLAAAGETVALLDQELSDPRGTVAALARLDPAMRGRVLGISARLGVDPDRLLVTEAPSPGEARKVAMARMLADTASVVVLDEPTNHLDIPSIEALEEALDGWPGTLLLVTHDERLAENVTTATWEVAEGRVVT